MFDKCNRYLNKSSKLMFILMVTVSISACGGTASKSVSPSSKNISEVSSYWSKKYEKNPNDEETVIQYARTLRAQGNNQKSVEVLQKATLLHKDNKIIAKELGKGLAQTGQFQRAIIVLNRAHDPSNPDWEVFSIQGASYDQLGKHNVAQGYYLAALKLNPNDATILSNLGLSYALDGDLNKAEETLLQAVNTKNADAKVRQNLALVYGMQGKFDKARQISLQDLSPEETDRNIAYFKSVFKQNDTWSKIRQAG